MSALVYAASTDMGRFVVRLGSVNRLRKYVYDASAAQRRKLNGRPQVVTKSIDDIPDS